MQAIIMAAGLGSRLRPLTNNMPKCFLEISNDNKLIDYQIDILKKHGVNEIFIVTGYLSKKIEKKFNNDEQVTTIYNPFYKETNVLGSMWFGKGYLNEDFIYMHGDTFFEEEIFIDMLNKTGDIVLPIDFKKCGEEEMKVSLSKNDKIKTISKKISTEEAVGEFIGIAKLSKDILSDLNRVIDEYIYNREFNHYFEKAIQNLIDENNFEIEYIRTKNNFWDEIDFKEDYENVKKYYNKEY